MNCFMLCFDIKLKLEVGEEIKLNYVNLLKSIGEFWNLSIICKIKDEIVFFK